MANRFRCYFCGELGSHAAQCVVHDRASADQYLNGFAAGIARLPALTSSHPMFLKGWCRGLRSLQKKQTIRKKAP